MGGRCVKIQTNGTLLTQAELMLGETGRALELVVFPEYPGFLLAILPPGAFIGLGLLVAGRNWLQARRQHRATAAEALPETA